MYRHQYNLLWLRMVVVQGVHASGLEMLLNFAVVNVKSSYSFLFLLVFKSCYLDHQLNSSYINEVNVKCDFLLTVHFLYR